MRIMVDARSLGQKPSGVGMYLYNFVKEISKKLEIQIILVTDLVESIQIKELGRQANIRVTAYEKAVSKSFGVFQYFRFIQKQIYLEKPDIFWEGNNLIPVHLVNPYGKIVVTIHDMFPLYMPECYGKVYPHYFKYGIFKTMKVADAILYNSKETKAETEKYFPQAKKKNSFISYIIVKVNSSTQSKKGNYFLYIGNLERRKGTDLLLNAYKKYYQEGGGMELHLAGKMREEQINALYSEMIKEKIPVNYLGYINEIEKEKELAQCSCFLFPSRAEGFGIPIIEALSLKKPVIASNLTIFQEIAGPVLHYFKLVPENEQEEIKNLALVMQQIHDEPEGDDTEIVNRYIPETLGQSLVLYFEKLVQE